MNEPEIPLSPDPAAPPVRRWRSLAVPLLLAGGATAGVGGVGWALTRKAAPPPAPPVAASADDWGDGQPAANPDGSSSPSPSPGTRAPAHPGGWWWWSSSSRNSSGAGFYRSGSIGGRSGSGSASRGATSRGGFGSTGHSHSSGGGE